MSRTLIWLSFSVIPLILLSSCQQKFSDSGRKQNFDSKWKFSRGDITGASQPDFNDSGWRELDLPHDWSVEFLPDQESDSVTGPFTRNSAGGTATGQTAGGIGWYRKSFTTANDKKRYSLYFEGIYMESEIWVNGTKAAFHPYGYTSFSCDITDLLNPPHQSNLVAIRVANTGKNTRWYAGSGIFRHVWLITTDQVHLDPWQLYVQTAELSDDTAVLSLETKVFNSSEREFSGVLEIFIIEPSGLQVASSTLPFSIRSDSVEKIVRQFSVNGPKYWSPDSTWLYTARINIRSDRKILDEISTTFGIRTISFSAEHGFLLNGKSLKLKGGCIHHDNGLLGAASVDRAEIRKAELLKANGFNAVRCAHNPPAEKFLEACDRLGLLVIDEAFDHWQLKKNDNDYHRYFDEWHERDLLSMVLRDRNHPSVIMWSIGNEIEERADSSGIEIARRLKQIVYSHDKTRPVTAAINTFWDRPQYTWKDSERAFRNLDVSGYNYAWGEYENDHKAFPGRIIFGSESTAREASLHWDLVEKHPYVIGDFVWTAIDYLGEAGIGHSENIRYGEEDTTFFMSWPWFNAWCGDIDLCGNQKSQGLYRNVIWRESRIEMVVHKPVPDGYYEQISYWGWPDEIPSWNWEGFEGKPVNVRVFSRAPLVRMYLNEELAGEQPTRTEGQWKYTADFKINYHPGSLKAVGISEGAELFETELKTAGPAALIRLSSKDTIISASRNSLSYITIELVDKEGNLVMDQDIKLSILVEGEAEIAASGNASPMDMESFRSLTPHTFYGRALAIIRPTGKSGTATLTVTAATSHQPDQVPIMKGSITIIITK